MVAALHGIAQSAPFEQVPRPTSAFPAGSRRLVLRQYGGRPLGSFSMKGLQTVRLIVTGADGALGRAVVERFRSSGAIVAALHGTPGLDLGEGCFYSGDLANEDNARAVFGAAVRWLGDPDGLVHLAGRFQWKETRSSTLADWRSMFEANLATAVTSVTAVLPHLTRGGAIVLVGAHSAQPAGAGFGPYGAAKSGVARLTEALAAELRRSEIRVNAVLPSIIDTPRNRVEMPDVDSTAWTSAEAIADVIAFLVSPAARAVSGALLPVTNAC